MFLDDEIYNIGIEAQLTKKGIEDAVLKIHNACFQALTKQIGNSNDSTHMIKCFNRVNNSYKLAVKRLKKVNRGFIIPEGFRNWIEADIELKVIARYLK